MKLCLLFAVVSAAVSINTQLVFYPSFARIPSLLAGLPGLDFSTNDRPYSPLNNDYQEVGVPYGDAEGRGKTFIGGPGIAESRQGDDLLGTVGGDLNLNSVPNPFLNFRKDLYRPRTKTVVVPPVCIACKCQVGFRSCADAGGRQWVSRDCAAKPALFEIQVGDECTYPAPPTLSACDPACVRSCLAKVTVLPPLLTDCAPIDAVNKKQCATPCENLAKGTTVKCNSAYPEVVSNVPTPCNNHYHYRYKRDFNISAPAVEANSQSPEIQSSKESSSDRSGRFLKFVFPPAPRVNVEPVTNFVRGMVTATYVAADGVCLPGDLASAPLCN